MPKSEPIGAVENELVLGLGRDQAIPNGENPLLKGARISGFVSANQVGQKRNLLRQRESGHAADEHSDHKYSEEIADLSQRLILRHHLIMKCANI